MKEVKGLISPSGESLIADLLDDLIKWKNPLLEAVDGKFFKILIKTIDNKLLDKIPQSWQNPIEPIIDAALNNEWDMVADLVSQLANKKIDVPWLDEESEALIFNSIISLVSGILMAKVEEMRK